MNTIQALAGIVIKELYRRKDFYVLFVLTVLITVGAGSANFFNDTKIVRYLKEICLLLIWASSVVIVVVTAARQIPGELESRTIYPLLAKPVTRGQVVLGKFLGCWLASGIALLVFYVFFAFIAGVKEQQWPIVGYVQAFWLHWVMLGIITALVLLGSVVFSAVSANATICLIAIVGIWFLGEHLGKIALRQNEPLRTITYTVYFLIPHLEFFDIREKLVNDQSMPGMISCLLASLYAAVYSAILLLLAWLGFRRKSLSA